MVAAAVGIMLFAWGSLSLYAFANAPAPEARSKETVVVDRESDSKTRIAAPPGAG